MPAGQDLLAWFSRFAVRIPKGLLALQRRRYNGLPVELPRQQVPQDQKVGN